MTKQTFDIMTKQTFDIKSAALRRLAISVVSFINFPTGAVWDAANDIGDDKGYGSEGKGELYRELWQQLGIADEDVLGDLECHPERFAFTIDGKVPAWRAQEITRLRRQVAEAEQTLRSLRKQLQDLGEV